MPILSCSRWSVHVKSVTVEINVQIVWIQLVKKTLPISSWALTSKFDSMTPIHQYCSSTLGHNIPIWWCNNESSLVLTRLMLLTLFFSIDKVYFYHHNIFVTLFVVQLLPCREQCVLKLLYFPQLTFTVALTFIAYQLCLYDIYKHYSSSSFEEIVKRSGSIFKFSKTSV